MARELSSSAKFHSTSRDLVDNTERAMYAGIAAAVPGNYLSDISAAIEDVARENGYGVIRAFVGHGIGTEMHEEPQVTNYRTGSKGRRIEPGLCLAIEPMFTLGGYNVRIREDGWTVVTADGVLAAHWEHTHRGHGRRSTNTHPKRFGCSERRRRLANLGLPQTLRLWYTSRSCVGPCSSHPERSAGGPSRFAEPTIHH